MESRMARDEIEKKIIKILCRLFKCDSSTFLNDAVGPGDIPQWDSMGHISLMIEIHKEFGIEVPLGDTLEMKSIKELVNLMEKLIEDSK